MHEEAVMHDLVRKVDEVARANEVRSVRRVHLWVGALSHLTESGLRARWPLAALGTRAEGAELDLELSTDPYDPRAQSVILRSLDAADGGPGR